MTGTWLSVSEWYTIDFRNIATDHFSSRYNICNGDFLQVFSLSWGRDWTLRGVYWPLQGAQAGGVVSPRQLLTTLDSRYDKTLRIFSNEQMISGSRCPKSSSNTLDRTSHLDIQIASNDNSSSLTSCDLTSCQSACGPNPSKITLTCVLVCWDWANICKSWKLFFMQILSIWVMAILLMHLDKKLALSSEALEATNEKMKSLEDSAVIFR